MAGRGEPPAAGFLSQGGPGHVAGSSVVPAVPSKSTAATGRAQARGEVCPHLGKAGRKGRGGVILEVNGKIDL